MQGLAKAVKEKTEDVQDLAEDAKEKVSRISRSFQRKSRPSRATRRDTFPSLVKWDQSGNNVSNAVKNLVENDENQESIEFRPTSSRGASLVCKVDAEDRLNLHEDDRVFHSAECRTEAAAYSSNERESFTSGAQPAHQQPNTPKSRGLRAPVVIIDSDEEEQKLHERQEVTRYRYRKHLRQKKLSRRPLDQPFSGS
ncbi:unnamed protein product [Schistocephalus solidus]|uniref:Breast cancer type 1 susceptibility protein homolog n=1 Tax=Schistocephalus solidus TaxID=70667 RepID=A0A183T6B8_SCHSO|nr:unnamed protein product [Schistocephalus solidus]